MKTLYVELWKTISQMEAAADKMTRGTVLAGLGLVHVHALASLHQTDGQMASVLALDIGRSATSFTPILDRLENCGMIKRKPHPQDRRAVRIFLTANGHSTRIDVQRVMEALASVTK